MDNWPWRYFFNSPEDDKSAPSAPRTQSGLGSGVIVERNGNTVYVLTNNHVAGDAKDITVVLKDKREFKAALVGKDERRDLAVVSFTTADKDISIARLGDSDTVQVGDWAIAIGSPLGLEFSVTTGTISALQRSGGPEGNISDFIQTDASINQGNSGGALANIHGEVIGINTWIASSTGGSVGLGFAVPINNAKRAIRDLIDKKVVKYGWLGIKMGDSDPVVLKSLGVEGKKGAYVESVSIGSPADKSGILPGDFIVSLDGRAVEGNEQLTRMVGDIPAGTKSEFKLIRAGAEKKLSVKIEERDDKKVGDNSKLYPGLILIPADSELLSSAQSGGKKLSGLIVAAVIPKSPAAGMGLALGDQLTQVNGKKVSSLKEYYEALNASSGKLSFGYDRDGQSFESPAYIKK
jgi:Do/DeqQ family serine protease